MNKNIESFKDQLAEFGLFPEDVIPDGEIHRFQVGQKRNLDGWYVLFVDNESAGGSFGDWKGINENWFSGKTFENDGEKRRAFLKSVANKKVVAQKEREARMEQAAKDANELWCQGEHGEHVYLKSKGINGKTTRVHPDGFLMIPLFASGKRLVNIQRIYPNGGKFFLENAQISGTSCCIVGKNDRIYVCEGYATGESVHIATGRTVLCAMNAGNIDSVVSIVRGNSKDVPIIICADNDLWTNNSKGEPDNVGIKKATECAKRYSAVVVFPRFKSVEGRPTDFNDLHAIEGIEAVKEQLTEQFEKKKKIVFDAVKEWATQSPGTFSVFDIDRDLGYLNPDEKRYRAKALESLCEDGLIERDPNKKTAYRTRDFDAKVFTFDAVQYDPVIYLWKPLGLTDSAILGPRELMVIAGQSGTGKTTMCLETLSKNIKAYKGERDFFYLTSEMSETAFMDAASNIDDIDVFKGATVIDRQFEPYDLIYSNPKMQDGIVFIDFLEAKEGSYSGVVPDLQKIYNAMRGGIAIVVIQKFGEKGWGKGGEGTLEKPRLYMNLDHQFRSTFGNVCSCHVAKCKRSKDGMANPEGMKTLYGVRKGETFQVSGWNYVDSKSMKKNIDRLKTRLGVVESAGFDILENNIKYMRGENGN